MIFRPIQCARISARYGWCCLWQTVKMRCNASVLLSGIRIWCSWKNFSSKSKTRRSRGIQNKFTWNCTWLDIMTTNTTTMCSAHWRTPVEENFHAPHAQIQRQFYFSLYFFFYLIVIFTCHKWRSKHHSHTTLKYLKSLEMRSRFRMGLARTWNKHIIYRHFIWCKRLRLNWCVEFMRLFKVVQMTQWPHSGFAHCKPLTRCFRTQFRMCRVKVFFALK